MTVELSDQKRGLSHISSILVVDTQILLQERTSDGYLQDGSRPQTHLLITIWQAVHVTRTLRYGSFKAAPSRIGRSLLHCCGYTENVHIPAPRVLALANIPSCPQPVLVKVSLRMTFSNPVYP